MFKDFLYVYKNSILETFKVLKKRPWIITIPLLARIPINLFYSFAFNIGILNNRFSYLIINLVYVIVLSGVFYLYNDSIDRKSISPIRLSDGAVMFMFDIYLVRFIFYILQLVLSIIDPYRKITGIVILIIYILFNPISELIYLRGISGLGDILLAVEYVTKNWYLWIPHAVLFSLHSDPISLYIFPTLTLDPIWILKGLLLGLYLLFRGVMFKMTYNSNRRKREFTGVF